MVLQARDCWVSVNFCTRAPPEKRYHHQYLNRQGQCKEQVKATRNAPVLPTDFSRIKEEFCRHKRNSYFFFYPCCSHPEGWGHSRPWTVRLYVFLTERVKWKRLPKWFFVCLFIFVRLFVKSNLGLKCMLLDGIFIGLVQAFNLGLNTVNTLTPSPLLLHLLLFERSEVMSKFHLSRILFSQSVTRNFSCNSLRRTLKMTL